MNMTEVSVHYVGDHLKALDDMRFASLHNFIGLIVAVSYLWSLQRKFVSQEKSLKHFNLRCRQP